MADPAPSEPRLAQEIPRLVGRHPAVTGVRAVGSRAEGRPTALSDWDFAVTTRDFRSVAAALPDMVRPLGPLAAFWDPLSRHQCFMMVLPGPRKVDLLFDEPHRAEPPWVPARDTLGPMDAHFWDWILWIAAKHERGRGALVSEELRKMHGFLLRPLGADGPPATVDAAIESYLRNRSEAEARLGIRTDRTLQREILRALGERGHRVSLKPGDE
jgi:hypothetical protein